MKYKDLNIAQKKRLMSMVVSYLLIGIIVLFYCSIMLFNNRAAALDGWDSHLSDSPELKAIVSERSVDATPVTVGTYVENLREVNLKASVFRVEFQVWFLWEGDKDLDPANNFRVYKGLVNNKKIIAETQKDGKNYQLVSMDVSVTKSFEVIRFPLDSHQMRFYVESTIPIEQVVFVPDVENSGINRNLQITGYDFLRHDIGATSFLYDSTHGDPRIEEHEMNSEIVTAFEINRSGFGLYVKCFIALVGTLTWTLIALFVCTYHRVDPLGMMPGALFGTVGNIMVGASLLPDALGIGLLEFVNIWGVLAILATTVGIININRIRNIKEDKEFAHYYGKIVFCIVLGLTVGGNILLPALAFIS